MVTYLESPRFSIFILYGYVAAILVLVGGRVGAEELSEHFDGGLSPSPQRQFAKAIPQCLQESCPGTTLRLRDWRSVAPALGIYQNETDEFEKVKFRQVSIVGEIGR